MKTSYGSAESKTCRSLHWQAYKNIRTSFSDLDTGSRTSNENENFRLGMSFFLIFFIQGDCWTKQRDYKLNDYVNNYVFVFQ